MNKGFNVIELLIVIAILGVLSAVFVPMFKNIKEQRAERQEQVKFEKAEKLKSKSAGFTKKEYKDFIKENYKHCKKHFYHETCFKQFKPYFEGTK